VRIATAVQHLRFQHAIAFVAISLLAYRAGTTLDPSWDSIAYHTPFAARLWGICDEACFRMASNLEVAFQSFPKADEYLQGLLWRLTGVPEATNFIGLIFLVGFILYIARFFRIDWGWATISLLAVPMIQIHATTSYTDLAPNIAATIGILTVLLLLIYPERVGLLVLGLFAVSMIFLGNARLQLTPIATLLIVIVTVILMQKSRSDEDMEICLPGPRLIFVLGALLMVLTLGNPIKNLIVFGSPFYPVEIKVGGHVIFFGPWTANAGNSVSDQLHSAPPSLRWLLSILDFRAFDGRFAPYTYDQGDVDQSLWSFRMGGYSVWSVLFSLSFLIWFLVQPSRSSVTFKIAITAIVSANTVSVIFMPASHELRYYMYWIISLLSINLIIYCNVDENRFEVNPAISTAFKMTSLVLFIAIGSITGFGYFTSGPSAKNTITDRHIQERVDGTDGPHAIICAPMPVAFLYSEAFQPARSADSAYQVLQEPPDDLRKCTKYYPR
jgi:hypothetical protein